VTLGKANAAGVDLAMVILRRPVVNRGASMEHDGTGQTSWLVVIDSGAP